MQQVLINQVRGELQQLGVTLRHFPRFEQSILNYFTGPLGGWWIHLSPWAGLRVIRHELGHYLVGEYQLAQDPLYQFYFGAPRTSGYVWRSLFFALVRFCGSPFGYRPEGFASAYGLVAGEEDFAECLALYLSRPRRVTTDRRLRQKLQVVRLLLKDCHHPRAYQPCRGACGGLPSFRARIGRRG